MKRGIKFIIAHKSQKWHREFKAYRDLHISGPRSCALDTQEKVEQEITRLESELRNELVKILARPRSMQVVAREMVMQALQTEDQEINSNE